MQGDFGCRAPDGGAAALLQSELTRSDSGLMCHTPQQSQAHGASRTQSCGSLCGSWAVNPAKRTVPPVE